MKRIFSCVMLAATLSFNVISCGSGPALRETSSSGASVNVAAGAVDVDVNTGFTLEFSIAASAASVTSSTFFVVPAVTADISVKDVGASTKAAINTTVCNPANAIAGTITPSTSESCVTTYTLNPSSALEYNTEYALCVTSSVSFCNPNVNGFFAGLMETFTTVAGGGSTYTVGGTVTGLSGTVVLQNNAADDLIITADGAFTFTTAITDGAAYAVTVKTNPSGQTCTVSSRTGTISGANVTNVSVTCTNLTITAPTAAAVRTALGTNNTYGMSVGLTAGAITMPACTPSDPSMTISYTIPDLPAWLSFNTSTRALTLSSGTTFPATALTSASVTYTCTDADSPSVSDSVTLVINDLDGGGVVDGHEYLNGAVPLSNVSFGWIKLNPGDIDVYRTDTIAAIPTTLTVPTVGMDPTDPSDDTADFDNDDGIAGGGTNAEEIAAGTNLMVHVSDGTFGADTTTDVVKNQPYLIVAADLDNDGNLDLALSNALGDSLSILIGNGDGTFAAVVNYDTNNDPRGVAAADFNGDGYLDLAVANCASDSVSIFINDGDGTFAAKVDYAVGEDSIGIVAADFNGDNDPDIAVANWTNDNVSVLINDGDGTFAAAVNYGVGDMPTFLATADFDMDGNLDLAVSNYGADNVSVLLGVGDGTFAAKVDYAVGEDPEGVASADFDNDGYLDLVVSNAQTHNFSLLLGNGDGTFGDASNTAVGFFPRGIAAVDFNGDSNIDVAAANDGGSSISVCLGNGDGTFDAKVDYDIDNSPFGIAAGDLDNDGDMDIAVTEFDFMMFDNDAGVLLNE